MSVSQFFFSNCGRNTPTNNIQQFITGFNTSLSCIRQEYALRGDDGYFHCNADGQVQKVSAARYNIIVSAFKKQNTFKNFFYSREAENIIPECREAAFLKPEPIHGKGLFEIKVGEDTYSVQYDTDSMRFSAQIIERGRRPMTHGWVYLKIAIEVCLRTSIFEDWVYSDGDEYSFFKDREGQNIAHLCDRRGWCSADYDTPLIICSKIFVQYETGFYSRSTATYDQEWVYFEGVPVYYHNVDNDEELHALRGRIESMKCSSAEECRELCLKMAYKSYN